MRAFSDKILIDRCANGFFAGDCSDMRSDRNCTDADDVNVDRLVTVGRLATRSVFALHRATRAHAVAVQRAQQRSGLLSDARSRYVWKWTRRRSRRVRLIVSNRKPSGVSFRVHTRGRGVVYRHAGHGHRCHPVDGPGLAEQRSTNQIQVLQSGRLRDATGACVFELLYSVRTVIILLNGYVSLFFLFVFLFYSFIAVDSANRVSGVFRCRIEYG